MAVDINTPREQGLGVKVLADAIEAANPVVSRPGTTYDPALASTVTFREYVSSNGGTDFRIITTIVPTDTSVRNGVKQ